jgi:hypothetical protein
MANKFVVTQLMGRCGNQFYQIATTIAHAKKHGWDYFVTSTAENCDANAYYFPYFPTRDMGGQIYEELKNEKGRAFYREIPVWENAYLIGYWQSFKYFDDYREDILAAFGLPYHKTDYVSIHVRRGDYLVPDTLFPPLPISYYQKAVSLMNQKGYYRFIIFSDDIEYCKTIFNEKNFPVQNGLGLPFSAHEDFFKGSELVNEFLYSEGRTEVEDLAHMANCSHNIVANSTFSYSASWLNRNPDKIVITPDLNNMFVLCNEDMIPDSYIQIIP